jgi:hypothetical protein
VPQPVGLGMGTGDRVGTAIEVGSPPHAAGTLATGIGVLSPLGGTVGTGTGVLSPVPPLGTGVGVAATGLLLGLAVGVVTGLTEAFAVVVAWCLPAVELSALAAVHPPHSRARPTTPPAARIAQPPMARARFCVESMYSS